MEAQIYKASSGSTIRSECPSRHWSHQANELRNTIAL